MRKFVLFLLLQFSVLSVFSQNPKDTLVVAPGESGLYFYHVLEENESLNDLAQRFGVSVSTLESNNRGVTIAPYEIVKVPVGKDQLIQRDGQAAGENSIPLYHQVAKGQTLYRIGKLYEDVPVESLRAWNHLNDNTLKIGQYIKIGWLLPQEKGLAKTENPPEKPSYVEPEPATVEPKKTEEAKEPKKEQAKRVESRSGEEDAFLREIISAERQKTRTEKRERVQRRPVAVKESPRKAETAGTSSPSQPKEEEEKKIEKEAPPVEKRVARTEEKVEPPKEDKKEEKPVKEVAHTTKKVQEEKKTTSFEDLLNQITPSGKDPDKEGESKETAGPDEESRDTLEQANLSEFEELFLAQTQGETLMDSQKGAGGWFKSNVKEGSKKYYALCNDLPRGTIIKVVNALNNKFVYAKVLSSIPRNESDYNLIVKLSDAARDDLEVTEPKFRSQIIFPKTK